MPVLPIGTHAGWLPHERTSRRKMYRACHGLLIVTACKLSGTA